MTEGGSMGAGSRKVGMSRMPYRRTSSTASCLSWNTQWWEKRRSGSSLMGLVLIYWGMRQLVVWTRS